MGFTRTGVSQHSQLGGTGTNDHHAQAHSLASHSSEAHAELSGVGTDDHHAQAHTPESHTGQGATAAELETLTDGSDADSLHVHSPAKMFRGVWQARGTIFAYTSNVAELPIAPINSGQDLNGSVDIPNDFVSLTSLVVTMVPDATETIQWDIATTWGALGEAHNANSDSLANQQDAATASQLLGVDVSGAFTGIAALDLVGIAFNSDTTQLRPHSIRGIYE